MLSNFAKEAIYSNVLTFLNLCQEGCPPLHFSTSIYDSLIEFAYSLDHALPEELNYFEEVLENELMGGCYITAYDKDFKSFHHCATYFFNETPEKEDVKLEHFLFGQILEKKIYDALLYWEGV